MTYVGKATRIRTVMNKGFLTFPTGGLTRGDPGVCGVCNHPLPDHLLHVAYDATVEVNDELRVIPGGGNISCPVEDCRCYATWSLPQAKRI